MMKHGMYKTKFYGTWNSMLNRCRNKNCKAFRHYGGRGIKVCKRWFDFRNYREDMFPSYKNGLSLDRIDNNGNYCKENCKWSTWSEQMVNRRFRVAGKLEIIVSKIKDGETQSFIARELGISQSVISKLLVRKQIS